MTGGGWVSGSSRKIGSPVEDGIVAFPTKPIIPATVLIAFLKGPPSPFLEQKYNIFFSMKKYFGTKYKTRNSCDAIGSKAM